ncbi:hypothetical protein I5G61_gp40 [Mycobacterium phage Quesadilla]|uniref:Uncharacterized protein n=1 Tax=Mycobacterium phage Quesadilla TaxID=2664226 RepID=A0A5Q2WD36_9CAUD|nr:hypothetical protein I5G61_gp40 [Mycobacterium phage Quesadilla]QGH75288.1 hypothetical protein SEA_QUESADILLA_40 [Mycobacterium phage Quesadilla]
MTEPFPCVDPDHFEVLPDGSIQPQPWMQWRQVRSVEAMSKAGSYAVTLTSGGVTGINPFASLGSLFGSLFSFIPGMFGSTSILAGLGQAASSAGNKNDLLHSLQLEWVNNSPVPQEVYGLITRGGCRVTLQARSRGALVLSSGYKLNAPGDAGALVPCSMVGCGADQARSGTLALGTSFCVIEERMNAVTIPLAPERAGWARLEPGQRITARVELRFVSEFWENTSIDGGTSGTESSYETGGTRLDLFAVPVL